MNHPLYAGYLFSPLSLFGMYKLRYALNLALRNIYTSSFGESPKLLQLFPRKKLTHRIKYIESEKTQRPPSPQDPNHP